MSKFAVSDFAIVGRVSRLFVFIELFAGNKAIVSREIVEETVVIGAVTIFKAFELNLSRLLFFSFVDLFPCISDIEGVERVENEKLKSPDDISSIFNVAGFLEALEGNGLRVVGAIERADNKESRIGVALKFFELADGIINTEFSGLATRRNNLKIIKAYDRSFSFVKAKRTNKSKKVVSRFVLKFKNAKIKL